MKRGARLVHDVVAAARLLEMYYSSLLRQGAVEELFHYLGLPLLIENVCVATAHDPRRTVEREL